MKYNFRIHHKNLKSGNIFKYRKNWYEISDWRCVRFRSGSKYVLREANMNYYKYL
jgi:hypothetical protein